MRIYNNENFDEIIKEEKVLVDFFATWCGPCKMMGAVLEEVENDINIVKVDVDQFPEIAKTYGVMTIPTLIIFKNGNLTDKHIGFVDKDTLLDWYNRS